MAGLRSLGAEIVCIPRSWQLLRIQSVFHHTSALRADSLRPAIPNTLPKIWLELCLIRSRPQAERRGLCLFRAQRTR